MNKFLIFCTFLALSGCAKTHKKFKPLNSDLAVEQHKELEIPPHLTVENITKNYNKNSTISNIKQNNKTDKIANVKSVKNIDTAKLKLEAKIDQKETAKKAEFYETKKQLEDNVEKDYSELQEKNKRKERQDILKPVENNTYTDKVE